VHAPGAGIEGELRVIDPDPAQEALERIGAARDHGNERDVAFGLGAGQTRELGVGDRVADAVGDAGNRHLAAPLADLNHERDIRAPRDLGQREVAIDVSQRVGDGLTRGGCAANVADGAGLDLIERRIRDVDQGVVERVNPSRIVDGARK
jgi:hypothetical protein